MSNVISDLQPQPDPAPATGDVWLEIITLMPDDDVLKPYCVERRQQGIDRYGTPLQRGNGRDHLLDALQEALDLMAYAKADNDTHLLFHAAAAARYLVAKKIGVT